LSGMGIGVSSPSIAASIANAVEIEHMGAASAALQLATQIGAVAGIQIGETIQLAREHHVGIVRSFDQAYRAAGGVALLGVVASAFIRARAAHHEVPTLSPEPMIG